MLLLRVDLKKSKEIHHALDSALSDYRSKLKRMVAELLFFADSILKNKGLPRFLGTAGSTLYETQDNDYWIVFVSLTVGSNSLSRKHFQLCCF